MNVLIGCESSGEVRDAFIAKGHRAMSCDLLDTDKPGPHFKGDVFEVIDYPWDLAIFFSPCTHLAVSGAKHFADKWIDGRQAAGAAFFMRLLRQSAHIPKTSFENPVGIMSSLYRKPDQIIQPWQFGHEATKTTCLWLKGLPALTPTSIVDKGARHITKGGNSLPDWYNLPPSPDRWKIRSATFPGIAKAMAEQWGADSQMALAALKGASHE